MKALALTACSVLAAVGACTEPAAVIGRSAPMSAEPERPGVSGSADPTTTAPTTTTEAPPTTVEVTTTTEVATTLPPRSAPRTTTTEAPRAATAQPVVHDAPPGVWADLAECESGMTNAETGNGFSGYFQFSLSTWRSVGETGRPSDYSYAHQLAAAQRLQARSGWGQWPACSRLLGLA